MSLIRFDYVLTPPLPFCLYFLHLLHVTFRFLFSFFLPFFIQCTSSLFSFPLFHVSPVFAPGDGVFQRHNYTRGILVYSSFVANAFMRVGRLEMEFIYSGLSKLLKPAIRIENSSQRSTATVDKQSQKFLHLFGELQLPYRYYSPLSNKAHLFTPGLTFPRMPTVFHFSNIFLMFVSLSFICNISEGTGNQLFKNVQAPYLLILALQ